MSKIVIYWNNNNYGQTLKMHLKDEEYYVCTDPLDRVKCTWEKKEVDVFVVLCELDWDGALLSELKGISLAQELRRDGVKAPIVFFSFLSADQIVRTRKELGIIKTPALQHSFIQLPMVEMFNANKTRSINRVKQELHKFCPGGDKKMRKQSDKDLAYTKMLYCDWMGMLKRIKHSLSNEETEANSDKNKELKRQLEYIIEKVFPKDKDKLKKELSETPELKTFCSKLIDRILPNETLQICADNRSKKKSHSPNIISILYLEDNPDDNRVETFQKYCEENTIELNDKTYNLKLEIVSDMDEIKNQLLDLENKEKDSYDGMAKRNISGVYKFLDKQVVICDIELKDKNGFLQFLGYDLIEQMANISRTPLYYIVTDMTRSVYDQVKPDIVKRIMLKEEAFGSKEAIKNFLYGVRDELEDRMNAQNQIPKIQKVFDYFYNYLKRNNFSSFLVKFKDIDGSEIGEEILSFEQLNTFVNEKAIALSEKFQTFINTEKSNGLIDFVLFNRCCKTMREMIDKSMQRGGKKFTKDSIDMSRSPNDGDLERFVRILILRRFFLWTEIFVSKNEIVESLENYRENELKYKDEKKAEGEINKKERNRRFNTKDLALRTIGAQYKALNKEGYENYEAFLFGEDGTEVTKNGGYNNETRLDDTLLFGKIGRKNLILMEEEEAFKAALGQCCGKMQTSSSRPKKKSAKKA